MDKIKVGDTIQYSTSQGIKTAKVEGINLCHAVREKYGDDVSEVTLPQLHRSYLLLDDGHGCYGEDLIINGQSAELLPYETDYNYFD